ncbi:zinc-binding dehydrogenase [Oceanobacillus jordanicus]|uniref:Zinc-binding dehydrogenase n=1 Tax=Oceanobacillus jordanicus TaxID=2867266 RepID=A0AAW5B7I9_9BACI|nr:zinc-binding dehydrogenase [Oceanobacillus jordanicus]MCG3420361.1 zinc-binding dehydrogenase [Oceanobacillus jordanicus]
MKAFVHEYGELKVKDMETPTAGEGQVLVALKVAGLNRRDLYIPNRRGEDKEALILGSDGAGIIESIGKGVQNVKEGDEIIINPGLRWYENSDAPPAEFDILGMPDHGTFAEKMVISSEQVEQKPSHLSWEEAGVLALSALTGYRALFTKGQIKEGETVFIPGAGSGVSTYLISFAKNVGARVIVTSRSEEKLEKAKSLGADVVLLDSEDWAKQLENETVDLVIDSVGRATFKRSLDVLKKGGRMVIFGATTEDTIDFDLRSFFYGQYQLFGSTMGSRQELRALLDHMKNFNMHPIVDKTFAIDNMQEAFEYLEVNKQFGKIAINL